MCNIEPMTLRDFVNSPTVNILENPDSSNHSGSLNSSNPNGVAKQKTILDEAAEITSVDRNKAYGPPRDNHSRTGAMFAAYLSGINGRELDYRDVCWLNVLQKASRDVFCRKRDNLVDAAGYLRNVEMAERNEGR